MKRKKILFICGSVNQTTMMHKISQELNKDYDCYFTPFYCDGYWLYLQKMGLLDFTIIGGQNRENTEKYLNRYKLDIDYAGLNRDYDLYVTCTDLMIQKNLSGKRVILIQEGMTDPENLMYQIVRRTHRFGVPRWLASTATTGLSDAYVRFCVASDGYRDHFVNKGVKYEKISVTGIPNFDNCVEFLNNSFPHRNYVLVATSDARESFKWDNRKKLIQNVVKIAQGRQIIFRLHPNENISRAVKEVNQYAPDALVYWKGDTNHMIANGEVFIAQYSSTVYVALALGKKVYSYFDIESLKKMVPIQNGGQSAKNISMVCREYL